MPIGLKVYLFWVRASVSTLHNCWPPSSLGLILQCCGCNKHINKYICVYIYTYKFLNAHTYFFWSLQRILNNVRTVPQTERCSNSTTLRISLSVHECCVSCSVASGRAVVPELQGLLGQQWEPNLMQPQP